MPELPSNQTGRWGPSEEARTLRPCEGTREVLVGTVGAGEGPGSPASPTTSSWVQARPVLFSYSVTVSDSPLGGRLPQGAPCASVRGRQAGPALSRVLSGACHPLGPPWLGFALQGPQVTLVWSQTSWVWGWGRDPVNHLHLWEDRHVRPRPGSLTSRGSGARTEEARRQAGGPCPSAGM